MRGLEDWGKARAPLLSWISRSGGTAAFRVATQLRSKAVGDRPHQPCHLPSAHLRAAGGGEWGGGGPSPGLCSGRLLSDAPGGMGMHGTGLGDWFPNPSVPEDHPLRLCENRRAPRSPGAVAMEHTASGGVWCGAPPAQCRLPTQFSLGRTFLAVVYL